MLLNDIFESAPADQVKGTEKAKMVKPRPHSGSQPHPFQGRLVGGESKEDPRPEDNFGPDDIKKLERTQDINDARKMAIELISMTSKRSMKPAKVEWFKKAVYSKKNVLDIVKLMYDLLLSGEGNKVIGGRHSMEPNSYRKAFGEDADVTNPTDKVVMDIPLFIRMMEYAREDAKTDMDLHNVTERAIELMQQHGQLSMENYDNLVGGEQSVDEASQMHGYAVKRPNGKLAKASNGHTWWSSSEENAHKANQANYGGEGEVVKVTLNRNQYAYNGYDAIVSEDKIKGVDGKKCWDGYRYAGKEKKSDGTYKDKCVKVSK